MYVVPSTGCADKSLLARTTTNTFVLTPLQLIVMPVVLNALNDSVVGLAAGSAAIVLALAVTPAE